MKFQLKYNDVKIVPGYNGEKKVFATYWLNTEINGKFCYYFLEVPIRGFATKEIYLDWKESYSKALSNSRNPWRQAQVRDFLNEYAYKKSIFEGEVNSDDLFLILKYGTLSPKESPINTKSLNSWDGYSSKGQAVYDAIFEQEKRQEEREDCRRGICSCCPGSQYYGI